MAFWRKHRPEQDPVNDLVTARTVVARLEAIADRQEVVYDRLVKALNKASSHPVDDPTKGRS